MTNLELASHLDTFNKLDRMSYTLSYLDMASSAVLV